MSASISIDDVLCTKSTPKAILVLIDGDEYWIPSSQIHDDSEVYDAGHEGRLVITEWIADQKGIM